MPRLSKAERAIRDHQRKAAMVISDLLASSMMQVKDTAHPLHRKWLFCWERDGLRWLSEQWKRDPRTMINMWTAERVREFEAGHYPITA